MKEIALIGFVQICFFSFLIFLKHDKKIKDYFLALFFILVGCELLYRYLLFIPGAYEKKWLAIFDITYWSLLGPSIYLYVRFVIEKNKNFESKHLVHFLPLIISIIPFIDYLNNYSQLSFIQYYNQSKGINWFILNIFWEFASAVYITVCIFILFKHKKRVKNFYSTVENKNLNWLFILSIGFAVYLYASYLSWILIDLKIIHTSFRFIKIIVAILTLYVFIVGIFGYKQEGVFIDTELSELKKTYSNKQDSHEKYFKSGLSTEEKNELKYKLQGLMKKNKPYLDPELNISFLADELKTSVHKLSQVINESYHKNFFDYINSYRVEEVKTELLKEKNDNYTIMAIAYDCGFNSKSSFYSIFKKHTQFTPSEFKKRLMDKSEKIILD